MPAFARYPTSKSRGPVGSADIASSSTVRVILPFVIGASLAASACDTRTNASVARDGHARPQPRATSCSRSRRPSCRSRVRAGATLASVLRAHDVAVADAAAIVAQAAAVFDLRKVRANQPYRLETTHTGTIRALRVRNRRRPLPARRPIAGRGAGREGAADSQDAQRRGRDAAAIDRDHTVAGGGAGRGRRDDRPHARARRHLRRRHRLHHRTAAGRSLRAHRRETVPRRPSVRRLRSDPRRRVHQRGPPRARHPLHAGRRVAGLLRRARPIDAAILPRLAAEVSAGGHVRLLRRRGCIRSCAKCVRTSASTTGRRPARRSSRSPTASSCPRARAAAPDAWFTCATPTDSRPSTCTCRSISVRAGARVRQGELVGRVGSTGLATGAAPRLPPEEERRVHQPDHRASCDAAGRADPPRLRWSRSKRPAIARWRRCPSVGRGPAVANRERQPCNNAAPPSAPRLQRGPRPRRALTQNRTLSRNNSSVCKAQPSAMDAFVGGRRVPAGARLAIRTCHDNFDSRADRGRNSVRGG